MALGDFPGNMASVSVRVWIGIWMGKWVDQHYRYDCFSPLSPTKDLGLMRRLGWWLQQHHWRKTWKHWDQTIAHFRARTHRLWPTNIFGMAKGTVSLSWLTQKVVPYILCANKNIMHDLVVLGLILFDCPEVLHLICGATWIYPSCDSYCLMKLLEKVISRLSPMRRIPPYLTTHPFNSIWKQ